ncbi:hypothetical protein J4405_05715 [Candidatus Woesearchaeota archaeon]|nr:hypothetical protein [Candidatus Woesearchaeota archaeon]
MPEIESLPYEQFFELSEDVILKSKEKKLLQESLETGDSRKLELLQIIKDFKLDSQNIKTPELKKEFVGAFQALRQTPDKEAILRNYTPIIKYYLSQDVSPVQIN